MSSSDRRNALASGHLLTDRGYGRRRVSRTQRWSNRFSHDYNRKEEEKDEHGLTSGQIEAFREVFSLFDINGGGTIDADELDAALKAVDVHLSSFEIHDVLQVIDEDGNGEIDFNEFLTLMTSTERYLETLRGVPRDEQKESLLFSALTKFMRKSALSSFSEIERYYNSKVRKSPHVVGHYAAGARLIGLTEKQMAKHLATLSVTGGENNDSPYAQPLCMFTTTIPTKILGKRRTHGKIRLTVVKHREKENEQQEEKNSTEEGSSSDTPHPQLDSSVKKPASAPAAASQKRKLQRSPKSPLRLWMTSAPLPAVSVKNPNLLTIEDLPMIRRRVHQAYENYRRKVEVTREEIAQNSTFTDLSVIPSRTLQLQFKHILEAYNLKATNIPPELEYPHFQPWHLAY